MNSGRETGESAAVGLWVKESSQDPCQVGYLPRPRTWPHTVVISGQGFGQNWSSGKKKQAHKTVTHNPRRLSSSLLSLSQRKIIMILYTLPSPQDKLAMIQTGLRHDRKELKRSQSQKHQRKQKILEYWELTSIVYCVAGAKHLAYLWNPPSNPEDNPCYF